MATELFENTKRNAKTMKNRKTYKASITCEKFLFCEMRIVADLMLKNHSREEIKKEIFEENLFQFPTNKSITRITNTCLKRIDALNSPVLINQLVNGTSETAKLINLYAFMRYNRVIWDFMVTVIGEKFRTLDYSFSQSDVNIFFFHLQEQNDDVAEWSDTTISRIKQILKNLLVECSYLDSTTSDTLNTIFAPDVLIKAIKDNGDAKALIAFNYFE